MVPFFLACENDEMLSPPIPPGQGKLAVLYTRIPVPFTLVRLDSVNTSNTPTESKRLLAGSFQHADQGMVTASSFIDFSVGPRTQVGDTAQYASLELELVYVRSYGNEQETSQSLEIRPHDQRFVDSLNYYSNNAFSVQPTTLGTATVTTKLRGAADTLRFRLDDALGQLIFDRAQAKDSSVLSGPQFREFFPGIALLPTAGNSFVSSFVADGSRMIMSFTDANNEPKEHTFTVRRFFNSIQGEYSGTPLAGLSTPGNETEPADGNLYVQSGTGVTPKITMDSVIRFIRSQSNDNQAVQLNRADLNLGLAETADTLEAPAALFAYNFEPGTLMRDSLGVDNQRRPVYGGLFGDQASQPGAASPIPLDSVRYRIPITNYLKGLIANDTINSELFILANDFESSVSNIVTTPDSVYMDVYYSVLKQ